MNDVKKDFPVFTHHLAPYVYLDNAATTHKPHQVIDAVCRFYAQSYATVYRGIYKLSQEATEHFEQSRSKVATFIGAYSDEIVFTKGATEGINFIATTWGMDHIGCGDHIIVTAMEHHANFLPWQRVARLKGAHLIIIPVDKHGFIDEHAFYQALNPRVKLVAIPHVSHIFGSQLPIERLIKTAQANGSRVLIDACQSVPHGLVDLKIVKPDFLVFSGHKMLGPTGIGVLMINRTVFNEVEPYQLGGGMVFEVGYEHATWRKPPHCYEAGTPAIAEVIGLGAAIDYMKSTINFEELKEHYKRLWTLCYEKLHQMPGVELIGPSSTNNNSSHIINFRLEGYHPHDIGAFLDMHGISVRAGDHCAQPLMRSLGLAGSVRISFSCYSTWQDCQYFLSCLEKLKA